MASAEELRQRAQEENVFPLRKPVVVVDWDGTCVEEKWPEMGEWLPGAVEGLKELLAHGYEVKVFSCRLHRLDLDEITPLPDEERQEQIQNVRLMLDSECLHDVDIIVDHCKPPAQAYIDDRAIRFEGNWPEALLGLGIPSFVDLEKRLDTAERRAATLRTVDSETDFSAAIRTFDTGATRDTDDGKYDYEGFLSPLVLREYAAYMHGHRIQSDGTLRASDNWQKGIPIDQYMKSMFRHFMDAWTDHRDGWYNEGMRDALCGVMFNAMGMLHEILKEGQ